jgi:PAP2 superfamily protein
MEQTEAYRVHSIMRLFGWLMPVLMLAAIVLTANHFLFDGLVGGMVGTLDPDLGSRAGRLLRCRGTTGSPGTDRRKVARGHEIHRHQDGSDPVGRSSASSRDDAGPL